MCFNSVPRQFDAQKAYNLILSSLPERVQRECLNSIEYLFARIIFPLIDPEPFYGLYSDRKRPCYPINILIAAEIFKQIFHYSDKQLIHALTFDPSAKIALHLYDYYDGSHIFDRSTLEEFRIRVESYNKITGIDLMRECGMKIARLSTALIPTDCSISRIDSGFVDSHIEDLDRAKLLYRTIARFLKSVYKLGVPFSDRFCHYLNHNDWNAISYHDKQTPMEQKICTIIQDMDSLISLFSQDDEITRLDDWELLNRVFSDQILRESDGSLRLRKDKSEGLNSQAVQNPTDPDATCRTKDGEIYKGYVCLIVETGKGNTSIRTYWQYSVNTTADELFLEDYLNSLPDREPTDHPVILVGDGLFSSAEAKKIAEKKNIVILTTNLSGKKPDPFLTEFLLSPDQTILLECPNHQEPMDSSWKPKDERILAHFSREQCSECPLRDKCPMKEQKKNNAVTISVPAVRRAEDWQGQKYSDDFAEWCKYRNGVECNFALLRTTYRIDEMPVRRYMSTRYWFNCVMMAINAKQVCKYLAAEAKAAARVSS